MTREEVIEILERFVLGAKPCSQGEIVDACASAYGMLKGQPSLPSNLDEAAKEYEHNLGYYECMNQWPSVAFKAGAEWAANEFENNRLKDCEALSEEDYKLESDFVDAHIKKNHRLPTFLDAIKYGAERMAEKYDDDSYEEEVQELYRDDEGAHCVVSVGTDYNPGDIVIVHSRKK